MSEFYPPQFAPALSRRSWLQIGGFGLAGLSSPRIASASTPSPPTRSEGEGSKKLKGVIIGGPLAGIVPPNLLDTRFGFEELRSIGAMIGHGGIVAFDERTSIKELMHHVFDFGAFESCGKCTPCREGGRRIEQIFGQVLKSGHATKSSCRSAGATAR